MNPLTIEHSYFPMCALPQDVAGADGWAEGEAGASGDAGAGGAGVSFFSGLRPMMQ